MSLEMGSQRSERLLGVTFLCAIKRGEECVGNFGHRRNDNDRVTFELRRNDAIYALESGDVADRRAAEFHYGWTCCVAQIRYEFNRLLCLCQATVAGEERPRTTST